MQNSLPQRPDANAGEQHNSGPLSRPCVMKPDIRVSTLMTRTARREAERHTTSNTFRIPVSVIGLGRQNT